ncbi:hypothetical protein [Paenibacillus polymyxa]|uniref:hypothetical protein n=1 Tax=Paenibacillus polymyxa TaxID=1406 RepID=UPI00201D416A|nr:hypothetical protein [Paenibacillus polymyxa]
MMKLNDHIVLWNHVFIQVMDVRHKKMNKGEELRSYRLPVSAFYIRCAEVHEYGWMTVFIGWIVSMSCMGGKGMCLSVLTEDVLEYYIILYKATLALPSRKELVQLLERENPFQNQYAFAPHYPLPLYDKVKLLEQEWHKGSGLGKLHVKALFHHFVFELLHQLDRQGI